MIRYEEMLSYKIAGRLWRVAQRLQLRELALWCVHTQLKCIKQAVLILDKKV